MPFVSFRDPSGFVLAKDGQVFRVVQEEHAKDLLCFLSSEGGQNLIGQGEFIDSRYATRTDRDRILSSVADRVKGWEGTATVLEHDPVWFASYPYEWPSVMLQEAARVTLDIASRLLEDGWGIKDATPYNILFRGPDAVFVDAMSVEKRDPADPIWRPLGQFLQTFLYPLLVEQAKGVPSGQILFGKREGISPDEAYAQFGWAQRLFNGPRLRWVTMPYLLGRRKSQTSYAKQQMSDPEIAQNTLRSVLQSLRKATQQPIAERATVWNSYSTNCHYDAASRERKRKFVKGVLIGIPNGRVLDVGANDGEYSIAAARIGHEVVACDIDHGCMEALWRKAKKDQLSILPLVVNIASPTPSLGWRNQETKSFLMRAEEAEFDCVLMLALSHHLTVTERVPMPLVLDLAANLTRGPLVMEWVSPKDPFYQSLLRGREDLHASDTQEAFERDCQRRFSIVEKAPLLEGRRWVYHLKPRE
jgi:2-polyprenyl-3-methyl-5-hydroxy-6-metoxy-1,4-benzoquinol methylase